jgi:sulfur-oxidizing protein SoxX
VCGLAAGCATAVDSPAPYQTSGDAIPQPLTSVPGDAARGRQIVLGRDGNCLLCHAIPETGERFMGNVGPPLSGGAGRLTAGQLRLRVVDPTRVNRDAVMPSYYKVRGLTEVALPYREKTILTAQQVEDVVAYLLTLRSPW